MRNLCRNALFLACFLSLSSTTFGKEINHSVVIRIEKSTEGFIVKADVCLPVPLATAWEVLTDFDQMDRVLGHLSTSKVTRREENSLMVAQTGVARYGVFSYHYVSEREVRLEPMKSIFSYQRSGNARRFESQLHLFPDGDNASIVQYRAAFVPDEGFESSFGSPFIRHEIAAEFNAFSEEMTRRLALKNAEKQSKEEESTEKQSTEQQSAKEHSAEAPSF